jgi:hypothetical protein
MRMVARSMNYNVETSVILAGEQAGFRQYSSTQQHVAMFSQTLKMLFYKGNILIAVFFYFESTHDLGLRDNLLLKLSKIDKQSKC